MIGSKAPNFLRQARITAYGIDRLNNSVITAQVENCRLQSDTCLYIEIFSYAITPT